MDQQVRIAIKSNKLKKQIKSEIKKNNQIKPAFHKLNKMNKISKL